MRFLALSYVWGASQRLVLSSKNLAKLAERDSLATAAISDTIDDTLHLAKSLEIDWVWVDALCIIQDSDEDKISQISMMSTIYSAAFVTVVAGFGKDANGGLPGVRPNTRFARQQEVMVKYPEDSEPGMSFMSTLFPNPNDAAHYLAYSTWDTRGWTMQERVLSNRVIAFTGEQVYWACQSAHFLEEQFCETPIRFMYFSRDAQEPALIRSARLNHELNDPVERFWTQYETLVRLYSRRRLTYDGDAQDAFDAIVKGMTRISGESFVWGMPCSRFEMAMSWTSFRGQRRRHSLTTLATSSQDSRAPFPSWAWLGWIGETAIDVKDGRLEIG